MTKEEGREKGRGRGCIGEGERREGTKEKCILVLLMMRRGEVILSCSVD